MQYIIICPGIVQYKHHWVTPWRNNTMERQRGANLIKAADGLPWSTCEQGFVSRGEILYGILATSVVKKVVYTKCDLAVCYFKTMTHPQ